MGQGGKKGAGAFLITKGLITGGRRAEGRSMDSLHKMSLYQRLSSLGKTASLFYGYLDVPLMKEQIKAYEKHFKYYNKRKPGFNRYGLSLISRDGGFSGSPDLDSLKEFNKETGSHLTEISFREPTPLFKECAALRSLLKPFRPFLARSHILRLNKGGFFPPHRDDIGLTPLSFRLFVSLCDREKFVFLLDDKRLFFYPGRVYFIDTHLSHSLFSFRDESDFLVFNVILQEESVQAVLNCLQTA